MIWPRRTFWLQIESQLVCRLEGSFWWTIRMETHVIKTIFLAFPEYVQPRFYVGWWITRLWKATIFYRSAHPDRISVEIELSSLNGNIAHSEGSLNRIFRINHRQQIVFRMEFVPQTTTISHVEFYVYEARTILFPEKHGSFVLHNMLFVAIHQFCLDMRKR